MRLRWRTLVGEPTERSPRANRDLQVGTYFWTERESDERVSITEATSGAPKPPRSIALDPEVEEHLALVAHHPGFELEVNRLRDENPSPEDIARSAGAWRISYGAMCAFVEADGEPTLDILDDLVFVEARPTAYVITVPRPLTKRRKQVIGEWLKQQRHFKERMPGTNAWRAPRKSHPKPLLQETLAAFERWNDGEPLASVFDSMNVAHDLGRQRLRRVYASMKEISKEGLKKHGP